VRTYARLVTVGLLVTATAAGCGRGKPDRDDVPKATNQSAKPASRTASGDPIIRLEPAAQTRIGIRTQAVETQSIQPEVVAFGRLEEDPARVFVLRAPVAGTLHFVAGHDWPRLGESLADDATVGTIEPRLAPADRIALTNQLASARADLTASTSSAATARSAYERTRVLNADNKNVSDRALEDAAARLAGEEAKVKTATDTVQLLENSLRLTGPTSVSALRVERGGEVVDILAQPGEAVEPGAPILRVAKLDRLLARVDVPVGEYVASSARTARIIAVGFEAQPVAAERVALVAKADPAAQGQSFLFRLTANALELRPGLAVTARIPVSGTERKGVVIPAGAVVRVAGKAYAFAQTGPNEFVRKELTVDQPVDAGFLATANFSSGDRVVVQGAQLLLSEEFKSQIAAQAEKG